MTDALGDPLARFRTSMGTSLTDHPTAVVSGAASSTGSGILAPHIHLPPSASDPSEDGEDGAQLLKLIDEATHAIVADCDDPPLAGASFVVTANASSSFGLPPPPPFGDGGLNSSRTAPGALPLNGSTTTLPPFLAGGKSGNASAPLPPPPPTSPPSFAEAIAGPFHVPGAVVTANNSPLPFASGNSAGGSSTVPPQPTAPPECMIVRNQKGVFLLQPIGKLPNPSPHHGTHSHPCTPPYAPPQYTQTAGSSPPISPLPSYALPPPLPAMHHLGASVQQSGGQAFVTPKKIVGQSPPNYPAPPPYRSPSSGMK